MPTERAKVFAAALKTYETDGNLDRFLEQFTDECEVSSVSSPRILHGKDGARHFWSAYRGLLKDVRSEFRNMIESDGRVALEWKTEGISPSGERIRYEGTSVLEFDGGKVKRFFAYFDPHRLGLELTGGTGRLAKDAPGAADGQPLRNQPAVEGP